MSKFLAWAGEIPDSWTLCEAQFALDYKHKEVQEEDEIITVFRDGEATLRRNRREDGFTNAEKEIGYQHIDVGDLLIHSMDGGFGAIGVSDSSGKASPVVHAYTSEKCDLRFIAYQLRSAVDLGWVSALGKGIRVRSTQFDRPAFASMRIAFPPVDTQKRIADYLDKETAEIDVMVSALDDYVELLEKRNQVAIDNSIQSETRVSLGLVLSRIRTGMNPRKNFVLNPPGAENFYITVRELGGEELLIDEKTDLIDDAAQQMIQKRTKLQVGDLLFCGTGATIGKSALVKSPPKNWGIKEGVYALTPNEEKLIPQYLLYALKSTQTKDEIDMFAQGSAVKSISTEKMLSVSTPICDLSTQSETAAKLKKELRRTDTIIRECNELRDLLLTRRQVLISDVVSGKKEV